VIVIAAANVIEVPCLYRPSWKLDDADLSKRSRSGV
jgi:hypothetical protein